MMSPQIAAGLAVLAGLLSRSWLRRSRQTTLAGGICVADGSIAAFCTGHLSVVSALAAAFLAVGFDAADHRLDSEHHSYLLCLASARAGTAMAGSRWIMLLEYGAIAVAGLVIALRRVMRASVTDVSHENAAPLR